MSENKSAQTDRHILLYFSIQLTHSHALKWLWRTHNSRLLILTNQKFLYLQSDPSLANKNRMQHSFGGCRPSEQIRIHSTEHLRISPVYPGGLATFGSVSIIFSLPHCLLIVSTHAAADCKNKLCVQKWTDQPLKQVSFHVCVPSRQVLEQRRGAYECCVTVFEVRRNPNWKVEWRKRPVAPPRCFCKKALAWRRSAARCWRPYTCIRGRRQNAGPFPHHTWLPISLHSCVQQRVVSCSAYYVLRVLSDCVYG